MVLLFVQSMDQVNYLTWLLATVILIRSGVIIHPAAALWWETMSACFWRPSVRGRSIFTGRLMKMSIEEWMIVRLFFRRSARVACRWNGRRWRKGRRRKDSRLICLVIGRIIGWGRRWWCSTTLVHLPWRGFRKGCGSCWGLLLLVQRRGYRIE